MNRYGSVDEQLPKWIVIVDGRELPGQAAGTAGGRSTAQ